MFTSSAKQAMDPLEREAREVERRRARMSDRAERVLHAKTRIMGVDTNAFSAQIEEKRTIERQSAERAQAADLAAKLHAQAMVQAEQEKQRQARMEREQLDQYRLLQAKEKKVQAILEHNEAETKHKDPSTTFLDFKGEDLAFSDRLRTQKAQQQDWLTQQVTIKMQRDERQRQDQADYEEAQRQINERIRQQEEATMNQKRADARALLETNRALAAAKKQREAIDSHTNAVYSDMEVTTHLNSDLLNEVVNPRTFDRANHPRPLPYHFKGFTPDQVQGVMDGQRHQLHSLAQKRQQEREHEQQIAQQQETMRRTMVQQEREMAAQKRESLIALKQEHTMQKKDKTMRDSYLNNVIYTNPVNPVFFEQFGQTSR